MSILVPSRGERFLAKTVADLCAKATDQIEIAALPSTLKSERAA